MAKIIGNTTTTPMAVPDWNQTDSTKADYIKNKPEILTEEEIIEIITESTKHDVLSIKDNFISMNSDGTPLDASGIAGVITVTGKENYVLKGGQYKFNLEKINELLNIKWIDDPLISGIYDDYDGDFKNKFNSLVFTPSKIEFEGKEITDYDRITLENMDCVFYLTFDVIQDPVRDFWDVRKLGEIWEKTISYDDNYVLTFENQIVNKEDFELVISVLLKQDGSKVTLDDFEASGQAYASPIYDTTDNSLKIGLGSYTKDAHGNVNGFVFGAGQGQSIATRSGDIDNGNLVAWDNNINSLVDGGKKCINNGYGKYSIITLEDENRKNEANGKANISAGHKNKTYQIDTFSFGGGNQSGMTEEEFNEYWFDSANDVPKNDGKGKDANGKILDKDGRTYDNSYGFEFTIGTSNLNLGKLGFVGGENNLNYGNKAILFGRGIKNFGKYALLVGGDDGYTGVSNPIITNNGDHNFFFGKGLHSFSGYLNKECNFAVLLGENLRATNDNCVIVGKNSGNANRGGNTLRFAVGVGTGNYKHRETGNFITPDDYSKLGQTEKANYVFDGYNGFEIYEGGVVRVNRKPTYIYDVARLEEINEINAKIDALHANGSNIEVDTELNAESENAIANKVVAKELEKKINIIENTSGESAYLQDANNQTVLYPVSEYATSNTIVKRGSAGRVQTTAPVNPNDCVNKQWFTDNFRTFYLHKLDFGNNIYLNIITNASLAFAKETVVDSTTGYTYTYATKTNTDYVLRIQTQAMWVSDERQGWLRDIYNPELVIGTGEGNMETPLTNKGILQITCKDVYGETLQLDCGHFVGDSVSRYHI